MDGGTRLNTPAQIPELQTTRLLLKPLSLDDTPALYEIYSDEETMRYWSSVPVKNMAAARALVQADVDAVEQGKAWFWAICLKPGGEVIGKCVLFNFSERNYRAEVGYVLNRAYWGRGLMSEAVQCMTDFAFDLLGLHRLEADTDPENLGSLRLLEKLGFKKEGFFRERWFVGGQWLDSTMLGLLKTERVKLP